MRIIKKIFILIVPITLTIVSCKKENNVQNLKKTTLTNSNYQKKSNPKDLFYCYSLTNNKKYNHKITGNDEDGNRVNGIINLEGEIGIGSLKKDDDNKEIEIVSEHIHSNKIIATDVNGYQYRLKFDE